MDSVAGALLLFNDAGRRVNGEFWTTAARVDRAPPIERHQRFALQFHSHRLAESASSAFGPDEAAFGRCAKSSQAPMREIDIWRLIQAWLQMGGRKRGIRGSNR
jgi:hypothetical protein